MTDTAFDRIRSALEHNASKIVSNATCTTTSSVPCRTRRVVCW